MMKNSSFFAENKTFDEKLQFFDTIRLILTKNYSFFVEKYI